MISMTFVTLGHVVHFSLVRVWNEPSAKKVNNINIFSILFYFSGLKLFFVKLNHIKIEYLNKKAFVSFSIFIYFQL